MKKQLLITALLFIATLLHARHEPPVMDRESIRHQLYQMVQDTNILRYHSDFLNRLVFTNDSTCYFNPDGTLYLFKILFRHNEPHVSMLCSSRFMGNSFTSYFFAYDTTLYYIGGSGLFNASPQLVYFDFQKKEWFLQLVKNMPVTACQVVTAWQDDNLIHVVYDLTNIIFDRGNEGQTYSYGTINLDNMEYHEIGKFGDTPEPELVSDAYLRIWKGERYSIVEDHERTHNYHIFDNHTGEKFQTPFILNLPPITGRSLLWFDDSTIYYRNEAGAVTSSRLQQAHIRPTADYPALYERLIKQRKRHQWGTILTYLVPAVLLAVLIWFLRRRTIFRGNNNELDSYEKHLSTFQGQVISREQLDNALGIENLPMESMRVKRSSLIQRINEKGHIRIERLRNTRDKRYIDYRIS